MSSFNTSSAKINLSFEKYKGKLSVFQIKLTDSALKSFETYNQKKMKCFSKIQFDKNQGIILVPTDLSDGNDSFRNFSFTIANVAELKDGRTECLVQTARSPSIQNIGSIQHKITVHASDDVYQNTLEKMSIAESESKKNCVKEIKLKSHERNMARFKTKHSSTFNQSSKTSFISNTIKNHAKKDNIELRKSGASELSDANFPFRVNSRSQPTGKRALVGVNHSISSPQTSKDSPSFSNKSDNQLEVDSESYPSLPKKNRVAHAVKKLVHTNTSSQSGSTSQFEDNLSRLYPAIDSKQTRNKYKKIFNESYEEYINLHQSIQQRLANINSLLDTLKLETVDSIDYKNTFERILIEHAALLDNEQHVSERNKWNYYHQKLTHLKELIKQFDESDQI